LKKIMKIKITLYVFLAFAINCNLYLPEFCFAQASFDIQQVLKESSLDEAAKAANVFIAKYDGLPQALYVEAVMEENAQQAMEYYNHLKVNFSDSPEAGKAAITMGHYYLARGLYVSARRFFLEIVENHSDPLLVQDALYFAAVCICAAGKNDACNDELGNFVAKYRHSRFVQFAKADLRELDKEPALRVSGTKISDMDGLYTLQVGAYKQINGALNLRNYFSKIGILVEVREKVIEGKTVYLVLVSSFETKQDARKFGDEIKKNHGKPYRVVLK